MRLFLLPQYIPGPLIPLKFMTCLNSSDEDSPYNGMDFLHLWDHIGILTAFGSTGARDIEIMDQGSSKVTDMMTLG